MPSPEPIFPDPRPTLFGALGPRGLLLALVGTLGIAGCDEPDGTEAGVGAERAAAPSGGATGPNEGDDGADDGPPARPRPTTDPEPPADEPLAHALWELARERGAMLEWHDDAASRLTLEEGERRQLQVVLLDGRCYRTVAVGDGGIAELDLLLYDPNGVLVREDPTQGSEAVLGGDHPLCVDEPGAYRLEVRAREGTGRVAVRTLRSML